MTFCRDYRSLQKRKTKEHIKKRYKPNLFARKINALIVVISIGIFTWAILNKDAKDLDISEGKIEDKQEDISRDKVEKLSSAIITENESKNEEKEVVKKNVAISPPEWKYIVVHHSGIDIGDKERYKNFHKTKYDSDSLLYHFLIGNGFANGSSNGEIEVGERWKKQEVGGHVTNDEYNKYGIGISLVGDLNKHPPTKKQMASLLSLVQYLMGKFDIQPKNVLLHKEVNSTECPGDFFPIHSFRQSIESITLASKVDK